LLYKLKEEGIQEGSGIQVLGIDEEGHRQMLGFYLFGAEGKVLRIGRRYLRI